MVVIAIDPFSTNSIYTRSTQLGKMPDIEESIVDNNQTTCFVTMQLGRMEVIPDGLGH
jgi:hypothetical protein